MKRHNLKNRVARSNEAQDKIRELAGEPIDIIRHRNKVGRRRKSELELRWYGADEAWGGHRLSDRQLSRKMKKIADFADTQGIETVSMGVDWSDRQDLDIKDLEAYGRLKSGDNYITGGKRQPEEPALRIQMEDMITDVQILQSTPDDIRKLAEAIRQASKKMETQESMTLLDDLVDKLRDIHLTHLYRVYKAHQTEQSLRQFVDRARQILEEAVGSDAFHMLHMDEHGHTTRRRASGFAVVRGGDISQHIAWKGSDGTEGNGIGDDQSILRWAGAPNLESLLSSVHGKKLIDQKLRNKATAAVYLLGLDVTHDRSINTSKMVRQSTPDGKEDENLTTFQAHAERDMFHGLRLRGLDDGDRVYYQYAEQSSYKRKIGATILAGAGLGAGIWLGLSTGMAHDVVGNHASKLTQNSIDKASLHWSQEKYRQYWNRVYQEQLGSIAPFMNGLASAEDLNATLHNKIAAAYMDTFGWNVNNWVPHPYAEPYDWIAHHINRQPSNSTFVETVSGSSIGDVPANDNATLFSITSPKGLPTTGYWYTGVYDELYTTAGDPPLNTSLGYERSFDHTAYQQRPWSEEQIAKLDYDYVVSSSYLLDDSRSNKMALPIPQGGTIVGAAIIDKDNPSNRVPLKIIMNTVSGTYESDVDGETQNKLKEQAVNNPSLQYYVKMTHESTIHNSGGLFIKGMPFEDMLAVAEQVKKELGLPKDASNEEVFNVIKSRKYSVTPFADEHVPDDAVPYRETGDKKSTIIEISKVLADLDSLNCNLASTLQILATGAGGPQMSYEQATGFSEDGDGFLSQKESHAWLIDSYDKVVDPTPTKLSAMEAARRNGEQKFPIRDNAQWGGILVGAALLIVAYKRRQKIAELTTKKRADYLVNHTATPGAINEINAALYGNPNGAVTLNTIPDDAVRASIAELPDNLSAKQIIQRRTAQGDSLDMNRRRAIRRILRHQKAFRRSNQKSL